MKALVLAAVLFSAQPTPVERGCVVYDDESYACGVLGSQHMGQRTIDFTQPYVLGCIPGGYCDDAAD